MSLIRNLGSAMEYEASCQEILAENMANANRPGYKGKQMAAQRFSHLLNSKLSQFSPTGLTLDQGKGYTDFTQGMLKPTGRGLDFAIVGNGFFTVQHPNGQEVCTRNGSFQLSSDGTLQTSEGWPVLGESGPIVFSDGDNPQRIGMNENGEITSAGSEGSSVVGKLQILEFDTPEKLDRLSGCYFGRGGAVEVESNSKVVSGALETTNACPIVQMAEMIQGLDNFRVASKALKMTRGLTSKHIEASRM